MKAGLCGWVAAAVLMLPATTLAQTAAPAGGQAAAPSARALELSRRIVTLMKPDASMESFLGAMPAEGPVWLREEMASTMRVLAPRMIELAVAAQAKVYSEPELEAMAAFYATPLGRSIAAKSPKLIAVQQDAMKALMPEIQSRVMAAICRQDPVACPKLPAAPSL